MDSFCESNVRNLLLILTDDGIKYPSVLTNLNERKIGYLSHEMKLEILWQECRRLLTHLGITILNEQIDFTEYAICCGSEPIRCRFKCQTAYHNFECLYRDGCGSCGAILGYFQILNVKFRETDEDFNVYFNFMSSCQTDIMNFKYLLKSISVVDYI